ncbi:hypothetical protein Mucpa_6913 [Mucilaginibacter paludis DSM 18603]|uniref:Uncharacterized protein n=2 Tax=Mucilaginibacter TaxID=423349 RepID=H1Y603_9SPHI|nr:hypothetical protein Mucpa_6913 [Mucilaginibacter paludis DSM 18603]
MRALSPSGKEVIQSFGQGKKALAASCQTTIDFDFMVTYVYGGEERRAQILNSFNNFFQQDVNSMPNVHSGNPTKISSVIFDNKTDQNGSLGSVVKQVLERAIMQTKNLNGLTSYGLNYFSYGSNSTCGNPTGGGTGGGNQTNTNPPSSNTEFTTDIDMSGLPDCFKKVMQRLEATHTNCVADYINAFTDGTPGFRWKVVGGGTNDGYNGITEAQNVNGQFQMKTTFYEGNFSEGSDLAVARTILHEGLHAYLTAYFRTAPVEAKSTYSQMYDDYISQKHPNLNTTEHNEFARNFLGQLATQLKLYGESQGYDIDYQYYSDLAWGGLTDTAAFKALSTDERNRILNTLLAEQKGTDRNGDATTKKGKSSGC